MMQASSPFPLSLNLDNDSEMTSASSTPLPYRAAMLQTILKLHDPNCFRCHTADPLPSPAALVTLRRLVELINELRVTAPGSPEFAPANDSPDLWLTPTAIAPYVSEEAYEVLDVLQQEQSEARVGIGQADDGRQGERLEPQGSELVAPLVAIADLVPYLLWSIARSSYRVMQLLEGVSVRQCQPEQPWIEGMLRLVAMLEIVPSQALASDNAAPAEPRSLQTGSFDLATGEQPTNLLDSQAWLQADENVLPLRQWSVSEQPTHSDTGQVSEQLQALQYQIQATTPAIQPLFAGVRVEVLQPGQDWQMGEIRLRLGFEFVPQASLTAAQLARQQPDLVEAEWVDEGAMATPPAAAATDSVAGDKLLTPVCIVERPRLLNPATLIRVTGAGALERFAQANLQPYLARAIARLKQDWNTAYPDNQLLAIVQQAWALSDQYPVLLESSLSPLLPELLMDELIPKLLWQITCSSYEGMQLLGGVPIRILQPGRDWQQGTLRLLAGLQIVTDATDWMLDLATGQPVSRDTVLLSERVVCQQVSLAVLPQLLDTPCFGRQPLQAVTLLANLQQQIHVNTPTLDLLLQGTTIEWLESEQDWQVATLRLHLALAFTADC